MDRKQLETGKFQGLNAVWVNKGVYMGILVVAGTARLKSVGTILGLLMLLAGCGGGLSATAEQAAPDISGPHVPIQTTAPAAGNGNSLPTSLPQDARQPWEKDESTRNTSSIDPLSDYTVGRDWFRGSNSGLLENGEAARLQSLSDDSSWAMYRLPMEGQQPGTLTADINLLDDGSGKPSRYNIAVANYASGRWDWHGPFTEAHLRLALSLDIRAGADYLSPIGNCFIVVLVDHGNGVNVVGLGTNPYNENDNIAPPQVTGLTATPVSGGLELVWNNVVADDLAGYRVSYAPSEIDDPGATDVQVLPLLTRHSRQLLDSLDGDTRVWLSAMDHSGNSAAPAGGLSGTPLASADLPLLLELDSASTMLGTELYMRAGGSELYDFDTDGDGSYDITGSSLEQVQVNTWHRGITRLNARGSSADGSTVRFSGASLIVSTNTRPVASALALPNTGKAPLAVSFTGTASDLEDDPSALHYAWDFDGDGIYEPDTDSLTPDSPPYLTAGVYNARFRATDSEGVFDVDTLSIQVTKADNLAPIVFLNASHTAGNAPLAIVLNCIGSMDPDGSLVEIAWDWDGDGFYDYFNEEFVVSHTYVDPGNYVARVRLEDDEGAFGTAELNIEIVDWGSSQTIDNSGDVGSHSSLAIVNGRPAISYFDETNKNLKYVRALDANGSSWGAPETLDTDYAGQYSSLVVVNGFPAICYYRSSGQRALKYIRAMDSDGTSWGSSQVIASSNEGNYCSMAIVNGNPAISYIGLSNNSMNFARAADENGDSWNTSVRIDPIEDCSNPSNLLVVNGNPAVCYRASSPQKFIYSRASNADGTAWNTLTLTSNASDGLYTSLAIVNGNPAIAFIRNGSPRKFYYRRAMDADGSSWNPVKIFETIGDYGGYVSLAVINGVPAISYYTAGVLENLTYRAAMDADGIVWGAPQHIDSDLDVGLYPSMTELNGKPGISYYHKTNGDLKFIRMN